MLDSDVFRSVLTTHMQWNLDYLNFNYISEHSIIQTLHISLVYKHIYM